MTTATVLINGALRSLGLLKKGVTTDADELADGLELLNQMLSLWSTSSLLVPARVNEDISITTSAVSYTIGPSGDLVTAKPLRIQNMVFKYGTTPYTVEPSDVRTIRAFNNNYSAIPKYYFYEPTATNGTLYFDKKPSQPATMTLDSIKALTQFTAATTDVTLQDGYDFALRMNLAVFLAAEYGKAVPASVAAGAQQGMDLIRTNTAANRESLARVDEALTAGGRVYNGITDAY